MGGGDSPWLLLLLMVMVVLVGQGFVGGGGCWLHPRSSIYFFPPQVSFSSNCVYLEMGSFLCLLYGGGTMREMSIKNTSGRGVCQLLCRLDL